MPPRSQELLVEWDRELHAFDNGGDDRTIIGAGRYLDEGESDAGKPKSWVALKLKGQAAEGELLYGLHYRFYGRWVTHPKYGEQFAFSSFVLCEPRSQRGVIRYLMQAPHIGEGRARILWEHFGGRAIEVVRNEPAAVVKVLPRFTPAHAAAAAEELNRLSHFKNAMVELFDLLDGRGFPKKTSKRALDKWGNRAPRVIRDCPYVLMQFPGIGFLKADNLYLEIGGDPHAMVRQSLALWHGVWNDDDGNTWINAKNAVAKLRSVVSGSEVRPDAALELAIADSKLAKRMDGRGEVWLADFGNATAERTIARKVVELLEEPPAWPDMLDEESLSPHQRGQLTKALQGRVAILTGSPGTGKSFTAAALIKRLTSEGDGLMAMAAPTGKAAVRLTEFMRQRGVNRDACTIHRLLGVQAADDDSDAGFTFMHNEPNPLPCRWLIIDEASMACTDLMASLVLAVPRDCHVLIIGDTEQLPPVGHGAPLRDLIAAGVPHGDLRDIHRNAGRIVRACKEIKETHAFDTSPALNPTAGENLYLSNAGSAEMQIAKVEALIETVRRSGRYDPKWHVQVLCAVNKNSKVSRKILNERLQAMLNPHGEMAGDNPFRKGDKLVCLKNSWLPVEQHTDPELENERGQVWVANGEIGEAVEVRPGFTVVELQNPYRVVRVPRGRQEENDGGDDDEKDAAAGCKWDLAYALSVHKSQGSSWPIVAVILDNSPSAFRVMSRNWIYTAISRAEEMCILVGRKQTALECCRRDAISGRKTFLVETISAARKQFLEVVS